MSLLNVPSTPFLLIFSSPAASLTPPTASLTPLTGIRLNPLVQLRLGMDRLAIWPIRSQTQVMSPRSASMSVASARRSTFRPETWASSKSTTRRSPPPRTLIYLDILEHHAAASNRQHAEFPLCWNSVHSGLAWGNSRRITIPLQAGPPSRKLVRTWIVRELFQVFSSLCQRRREIETKSLQTLRETGKISTKYLNGKLNWSSEEKNWLSKDCSKLRQTWRSNIGKRENQILPSMRSIRSSRPNDFSYNKPINGQIRLNEIK